MALTHLADTSVLTRLGRPSVRTALEPLARAGRLGRAQISDLEIGYSARTAEEWDVLVRSLASLELVPTTQGHVVRALHVQRQLAAASQRGRKVPDLLVAAAAEALGATVLHYDADFDLIGAATGQPCTWVVPRGSVD